MRNCENIFKNIVETWNVEAKQESEKLFFYTDEVNNIMNGRKCYIIGRKGMGKTAIAEYLYNRRKFNVFTERLSFKNFPFNVLYNLENKKYTAPNQYITIWKYLIYNKICKMMSTNQNINPNIMNQLTQLYSNDPERNLDRLVEKWTTKGMGINVANFGINFDKEKEVQELSWIEKSNILEDVIDKYIDDSQYYVLIDELDEDYQNFKTEQERETYAFLLTSLFKAVQDVKATLGNHIECLRPVVFLRSDIYSLIKDSDKNKWSDYKIDLVWEPKELYKMLCHRIYVSSQGQGNENISESNIWNYIFEQRDVVNIGNRGRNHMPNFDYITRSTHWRPRDYIRYIRECCDKSLNMHDPLITSKTVKRVDRDFSEYLKNELIDEMYPILPDIEGILAILSQIRKQTFSPKDFVAAYRQKFGGSEDDAKGILLQLFEHGIVGNQPSKRRERIFKYQYKDCTFNHTENIVIHRGLYKALQIF